MVETRPPAARSALALGVFLWASPAWAQERTGAPGAWRGRQITTPPPPPLPSAPEGVVATPAPQASQSVWTPPAPDAEAAASPPLGTELQAADPQAAARAALLRDAGALLKAPYRTPAPPPERGRGIDRVVRPGAPGAPAASPAAAPAPSPQPEAAPLGIDPYQQVSYTAYTLGFGEAEVGLGRVAVGIAPRVQLSTNPVLDGIGAGNLAVKADVIRAGPVDFGVETAGYRMADPGGFDARWMKVGGAASVVVVPRWSLHVAGSWNYLSADGLPQSETLRPLVWSETAQQEVDAWLGLAEAQDLDLRIRQALVSLRVATDLRLTKRDSLVLQASGIPFGMASQQTTATVRGQTLAVPPVLQLQELLVDTRGGSASDALANSYLLSLAYQASWDHLQFRLGWGTSATELAWLLQTFELGWRFGGRRDGAAASASGPD